MSSRDEDSGRSRLFDGPVWLGYPHDGHEPVSLREYLDARPKDSSTRYLAASYQSLLTFGLLEAVIEAPVAEEMLLEKNRSGKLVMTTDRLVDVVRSWLSRIEESQPEALRTWFQRARANLSLAHSFMVSFTSIRFSIFEPLGDEIPSMVCFIAIIAEALVNAHAKMIVGSPMPKEGFSWSMIWTPPNRESLRREMHDKGWCPSTIEYLASTGTVSSLRYACEQGPLIDGKNHSACTPQSCAAYDIDTKTYVPKHDSTCGSTLEGSSTSCKYCMSALEQVIAYIKDDHVPVFTFGSSGLEVHISSDMPYIALSHVWADGLGSTSEDGLPMCQLKRLSALISTLRPNTAFWIDSLCVPEAKDARKKAIGMMARIYQEAEAVLVLDSSLQLMMSTEPIGARLLAVLTSGWMRRLWTLQEGVLAKELYIQFADTHKALTDLVPHTSEMLVHPYQTDLAAELFRMTKRASYHAYTIGDVARAMRWRNTTRATDETLAIASLLGIQVSPFLSLTGEERMLLLFKELQKFPKNILFLLGSKIDIPGSRWVPKSLMTAHNGGRGGSQISPQGTDATYTSKGLQAAYYALMFSEKTIEAGRPWMIRDTKSHRLYEVLELSGPNEESYQCSLVLTLAAVPPGSALPCVTALAHPESAEYNADGSFVVPCEYKRRLVLFDVSQKSRIEDVVDAKISGMLQVCVG